MKLKTIITEKAFLFTVVVLLLYVASIKRCKQTPIRQPKITIVKDTIWQTKIDTLHIETTKYQKVYIPIETHKKGDFKEKITLPEKEKYTEAKLYKDTLRTDDIDIFTHNLIKGNLVDSKLSYKLKVPREITITKTIEHPPTYRSGLYVFGEAGGNKSQFSNISLGLQYQHKGKWFAAYRVNFNELPTPTHNVGIGFRLW